MKETLITLLVGMAIYEIVEHILLPLFWAIRYRGRISACGPSGMIGKRCVVKQWAGTRGKVWVGGELWNAIGNLPLMPGDEGFIQRIDNLTLRVDPLGGLDEEVCGERTEKSRIGNSQNQQQPDPNSPDALR